VTLVDLIRAVGSLKDRHRVEDAPVAATSSDKTRSRRVVSRIESMASVVIEVDEAIVDALRNGRGDDGLVRGGGGRA
jgi:hypothetical protein